MKKAFSWAVEVWDYKSKDEFLKHCNTKIDKGFRVWSEYVRIEDGEFISYTVEYRRNNK